VLGRALQREDGRGKVTGEAYFTADVIRPDILWGQIPAAGIQLDWCYVKALCFAHIRKS
jgi:hypothetical protein